MKASRLATSTTPSIDLRPDGTLLDASRTARYLLDLDASGPVEGSFFALLHGHNVPQVSRDLTEMVRVGKRRVAWLVRVRVGRTWRWVKATATNLLETSVHAIRIELTPVMA
ncbi:MAG: hypothetical protein IAE99_02425 [Rhodothermales bacterium]|nr:hypothetical protein [Rhodothermales bacterium]MCA0268394.1 hypothetical protein [Bacteroidota bacterium]